MRKKEYWSFKMISSTTMIAKLRAFYLFFGFLGLAFLLYQVIVAYPDFNPINVLMITIPDMLLFLLAYRTYPVEPSEKKEVYQVYDKQY